MREVAADLTGFGQEHRFFASIVSSRPSAPGAGKLIPCLLS
jgi:hypothetical protein